MKSKRTLIQFCLLSLALLSAPGSEAATLLVTNTVDSSPGSLRLVIASAAPGDTITFATNLSGAMLHMVGLELSVNQSVSIDASALPGGIIVSKGAGLSRVVTVADSATVVMTALTIENGNDQTGNGGGGIYNAGNLTLNRCTLATNAADYATGGGGAIFNSGTLTLNQCTLFGNHSDNDYGTGGGAIYSSGTLTINQSTIYGNNADNSGGGGGGIYNSDFGMLTVYNSIVAGNSANGGSGADMASFTATINFLGNSIVQDFIGPFSGNFPINSDPHLRPLGNYGGPTPTMVPLPGSPARFACNNSLNFVIDQRGIPRVNGEITDIGAVKLAPPLVTTLAAMAVVNTNATLNATVNPGGQPTTAWFQWGVTSNPYSNQTTPVAVGSTNTALAFSNLLTTLTPGVVYHCSVVATNLDGTANGIDVLFGSAPVVTLFGSASVTNECHTIYTDSGATNAAHLPMTVTGHVNTNAPNAYQLTYTTATNSLGLAGSAFRVVTVADTTVPVITVLGANPFTNKVNIPFIDPGATALDACGGNFAVTTNGTVNLAVPGNYTITYSSTDSYGNTATAARTVVVRTPVDIVTTTNDSGPGSLRQAIADSFPGDTINFATNLSGATILLTNGQLTINTNLTINASALPGGIQINGNGKSGIFRIANSLNVTVVLTALTIANGSNTNFGSGGIDNPASVLTLNQCTLAGNYADSDGGGIANGGTLTLNQCTLTGNHVDRGVSGSMFSREGGGIYNFGILTVNESTFIGNFVDNGPGGAIGNEYTLVVNQSTLTGNHADTGGGINSDYLDTNSLTVIQSTVTGNDAKYTGGGIDACDLVMTNSIVAGNSATISHLSSDIYCFVETVDPTSVDPVSSGGYALFGGANIVEYIITDYRYDGPTPVNASPQLAFPGNYGGPTQTMPPLPGSPAIDACDSSIFTTDQRGFPRLVGAFSDIGAVEGIYSTNGPGQLKGMTRLGNGSIQFTFTNLSDVSFTALASTNLTLPLNNWSNLGPVVESPIGSGQFQFTDLRATNYPQRFYRVRMP